MGNTQLLEEYKALKRKRAEQKRLQILDTTYSALRELSKVIPFKKAYIYGSILNPRFTDDSDIDIAFEGLDDSVFFKAMAFLSEFIGRDVDIVQIEGYRLKDKILNESIIFEAHKNNR